MPRADWPTFRLVDLSSPSIDPPIEMFAGLSEAIIPVQTTCISHYVSIRLFSPVLWIFICIVMLLLI